eukprot:1161333-Pelagomonas_calceolata.AAC.2
MAGCQISRPSIKRAKAVLASVSAAAAADPKKSTRYVPSFNPSMLDKPKPKAFDDDEPDEVEQMGDVHASQTLHVCMCIAVAMATRSRRTRAVERRAPFQQVGRSCQCALSLLLATRPPPPCPRTRATWVSRMGSDQSSLKHAVHLLLAAPPPPAPNKQEKDGPCQSGNPFQRFQALRTRCAFPLSCLQPPPMPAPKKQEKDKPRQIDLMLERLKQ